MDIPILKLEDAKQFRKCTLAYGHFNSVHPGHIRYLKHASLQGNKLIVAIRPDKEKGINRNYQFGQRERAEGIAALNLIDGIVLLNDEDDFLLKAIKFLDPKLLVLGKEFENSKEPIILNSLEFMNQIGKPIQFHAGEVQYASTQLLDNYEKDLLEENRNKFKLACKRQKINLNELFSFIDSWEKSKILVIGDSIVDQYAGCEAIGMSAEAPVVVVKELQKRNFLGGASIVAAHIRALGAKCHFLSVIGRDENASILKQELQKQKINFDLIEDSSRPTTFKKRYVVENQKLFRVSRLNDHLLEKEIEDKMITKIEELAPKMDGIIISDFVYGVVTERLLEKICSLSKKYKIKIFGDLQCSSQIGLVTKFKRFNLILPNEREARIALQDKDSGLETLSNKLLEITKSEMIIMKLGADGFIAYDKLHNNSNNSQSFPSLSVNPVDVSGAGDSLLAVFATGISSGGDIMSSSALACCMAAIAVETMGNIPIKASSLRSFLERLIKN